MERSLGYRFCAMMCTDCSELGSDEGDGGDGSGLESQGTGDLVIGTSHFFAVSPGVGSGLTGGTLAVSLGEFLEFNILG